MTRPDVVAIGDVHGCAALLEQQLLPHLDSGVELIFLGDLIDRAPEPDGDRKVLERVWQLQNNPGAYGLAAVTVLRGNHEQMLLESLASPKPGLAFDLWRSNGGNPALLPWRVSTGSGSSNCRSRRFAAAICSSMPACGQVCRWSARASRI